MKGKNSWKWSAIAAGFFSVLIWVSTWGWAPTAFALTQVKLSEVSYHECPPEIAAGAVTSGGGYMTANCFIVTGTADNPSNKTVYDADIYGRIYDANGDTILQNRTRIGAVESIPSGKSTFEFRISVPSNQPVPLRLEQFKAVGFTGKVRRAFINNHDEALPEEEQG